MRITRNIFIYVKGKQDFIHKVFKYEMSLKPKLSEQQRKAIPQSKARLTMDLIYLIRELAGKKKSSLANWTL